MTLSLKRRKEIFQNVNTLDLTPVKLYPEEVSGEKIVTVLIPKFKNKIAKAFIPSKMKSADFKVKLEKFGSAVWLLMDGKKNVGEIIDLVEKEFGEEIHPADERISKYIFQLYDKNLISFNEINE
ncbi:MAG: PqqD family protein [Ignavibacteria bacterium]|nr:PqqD family protein [Ignavibacteria bacterium]MDP3830266.1 PqqD family protein [Ignavibacteriaceae bacterium]